MFATSGWHSFLVPNKHAVQLPRPAAPQGNPLTKANILPLRSLIGLARQRAEGMLSNFDGKLGEDAVQLVELQDTAAEAITNFGHGEGQGLGHSVGAFFLPAGMLAELHGAWCGAW